MGTKTAYGKVEGGAKADENLSIFLGSTGERNAVDELDTEKYRAEYCPRIAREFSVL